MMLAPEITSVASQHGVELKALPRAAEETATSLKRFSDNLRSELGAEVPPGLDVVLLGSFGRGEVTSDSDCDYLLLLDGTPKHSDIKRLIQAVETTRSVLEIGEAGRTGTFGDFVTATELFARIGLEADSNANTTRRLLLLSESVSVLNAEVSKGIKGKILHRYLGDYAPESKRERPIRVPHFLLNDLTRYWRTIAVDFGAKQWRSLASEWHLRHAKLLTTRKVLFAGTLAVILDTENAMSKFYTESVPVTNHEEIFEALVKHVAEGLERSPLARLMSLHDRLEPDAQTALGQLLKAYDDFLAVLDNRFGRNALAKGTGYGGVSGDEKRQAADEAGRVIHEALLVIFNDDPLLSKITREYAVF